MDEVRTFSLIPFLGVCFADIWGCDYDLNEDRIAIAIPDEELPVEIDVDKDLVYHLVIAPTETSIVPYSCERCEYLNTTFTDNDIISALDPQLVPTYRELVSMLAQYILVEDTLYNYDTKQVLMAKFFK